MPLSALAEPLPLAAPDAPLPDAARVRWLTRYTRVLVGVDALALTAAGLVAVPARFGPDSVQLRGQSYYVVALALAAAWLASLGLARCYEARFVGTGTEEFRRVANASVRVTAAVALFCYATQVEVARGFVAVALPAGLAFLLLGRYLARVWLHRERRQGRCRHRVVVVGGPVQVEALLRQLDREPLAGLSVVGVCLPGHLPRQRGDRTAGVPVVGPLTGVLDVVREVQADTVAVTASPGLTAEVLRRLAYELEGSGVDLLVAPALTDVTGSRVSIRPLAGLPLLHLDEPELAGARKLLKGAFDRSVAALALVLLLPVLLGLAAAVRLDSPGPALFRQQRVGLRGRPFTVWKLRTMGVDAEERLGALRDRNEHDGVLFKIRQDPRVTRVGRVLRKHSLDELPQLVNVLRGEMSLVGPRPPLQSEVDRYTGHAHRRLLVKPGMTGLWQVSGRSELSWDDTVRLDLRYVEDWSLGLDLAVLAKTVTTVLKGRGAY